MRYCLFKIYLFFKAIDQDDELFFRAFVFYKEGKPDLLYKPLNR